MLFNVFKKGGYKDNVMLNMIVLGLSYKTTPVELREKISVPCSKLQEVLLKLYTEFDEIKEVVVLSTCNRVEIYAVVSDIGEIRQKLIEFLCKRNNVDVSKLSNNWYFYYGKGAIQHLLRVASSLDSMIIGETQILGQVKKAYFTAFKLETTSKILNILFQQAFRVAKKIRTLTDICKGTTSVASTAVELAQQILGSIVDKTVMIIGTGKMGKLAAKHMITKGVKSIVVSSRTYSHAKQLADMLGGRAVRFDRCFDEMVKTDIAISATGAPHHVITKKDVLDVMHTRNYRELLMIDIAVPGDIELEVREIKGVILYDIDHLQYVVDTNILYRRQQLHKAERIIEDELSVIFSSLQHLPVNDMDISTPFNSYCQKIFN
jgi:glutamyl-tRNA reductase